jgi:hypothetical protein
MEQAERGVQRTGNEADRGHALDRADPGNETGPGPGHHHYALLEVHAPDIEAARALVRFAGGGGRALAAVAGLTRCVCSGP